MVVTGLYVDELGSAKHFEASREPFISAGMSEEDATLISECLEVLGRYGSADREGLIRAVSYRGAGALVADALCGVGSRLTEQVLRAGFEGTDEQRQMLDLAVRVFERAIEVDSLCWRAYREQTVAYLFLGMMSEAMVLAYIWSAKARGYEVEQRAALFFLGVSQMLIGSPMAAVATYERALDYYPCAPEMHFGLALSFIRLGRKRLTDEQVRWLSAIESRLVTAVETLRGHSGFSFRDLFELMRDGDRRLLLGRVGV